MKSHMFRFRCGPHDFSWNDDELPDHLFIQGDVRHGVWHHLLGSSQYDIMMISPPCPAFSMASTWQGLMREDGRLTLDAWGLGNLIRSKIIVMEMVCWHEATRTLEAH